MQKEPAVTFIIPFYGDQFDCVVAAVSSIKNSNHKNLKIILIDNGTKTKTSKYINENFPEVKVIISDSNLGVSGGRNLGIDNLYGNEDYVIFFDSDQVVDKNLVSELLKPFDKEKNIGVTTPKIYYHPDYLDSKNKPETDSDDNLIDKKTPVWSAGTDIDLTTGKVKFRIGNDNFFEDCEVSIAPGVLCVPIELLKKVGKFDTDYVSNYEDSDFCFRVKKLGYKIYFCHKALAWHKIYLDSKGSEKKLLTRLYYIGRNRIIFMKKYSPNLTRFYLLLPFYAFYYLFISLRNLQIKPFLNFIRGLRSGLEYKNI